MDPAGVGRVTSATGLRYLIGPHVGASAVTHPGHSGGYCSCVGRAVLESPRGPARLVLRLSWDWYGVLYPSPLPGCTQSVVLGTPFWPGPRFQEGRDSQRNTDWQRHECCTEEAQGGRWAALVSVEGQ